MRPLIYNVFISDEERTKTLSVIRRNKLRLIKEFNTDNSNICFQLVVTKQQVPNVISIFKNISFVCEYDPLDDESNIN